MEGGVEVTSDEPEAILKNLDNKTFAEDQVDSSNANNEGCTFSTVPGVDEQNITLPTEVEINTVRQYVWYVHNDANYSVQIDPKSTQMMNFGWNILPTQLLSYYLKPSDLHGICGLSSHVTIEKLETSIDKIISFDTLPEYTDLITLPSNQAFLMVYTDRDHDLPILNLETVKPGVTSPLPPVDQSMPGIVEGMLPKMTAYGPNLYFAPSDCDPMNTGKVEYHSVDCDPIVITHEVNKRVPVSVLTWAPDPKFIDPTYHGTLVVRPAVPDGPDKWYTNDTLAGPAVLAPETSSFVINTQSRLNPISGIPNQPLPTNTVPIQYTRENRYGTKALAVEHYTSGKYNHMGLPNQSDKDKHYIVNVNDPSGANIIARDNGAGFKLGPGFVHSGLDMLTYPGPTLGALPNLVTPKDPPYPEHGDESDGCFKHKRPKIDEKEIKKKQEIINPDKSEEEKVPPFKGINFEQYTEQRNIPGQAHLRKYGTRLPRMNSIPCTLLKVAPINDYKPVAPGPPPPGPSPILKRYGMMLFVTMKAKFKAHRNRVRFDYLRMVDPLPLGEFYHWPVYSGTNVHNNIEGMGNANCFA